MLVLPLNGATIILGCIFSTLFSDFRARGPISIFTPPIAVLIEFFHADAEISISQYRGILRLLYYDGICVFLYAYYVYVMISTADAVSSDSWPILFKVLTLNLVICIEVIFFLYEFCN